MDDILPIILFLVLPALANWLQSRSQKRGQGEAEKEWEWFGEAPPMEGGEKRSDAPPNTLPTPPIVARRSTVSPPEATTPRSSWEDELKRMLGDVSRPSPKRSESMTAKPDETPRKDTSAPPDPSILMPEPSTPRPRPSEPAPKPVFDYEAALAEARKKRLEASGKIEGGLSALPRRRSRRLPRARSESMNRKWMESASELRRAIVLREILGPPKALEGEQGGF